MWFLLFCCKFNFNEFSNSLFIRLFIWRHWILLWRRYMVAERKHNQGSLWVLTVFNEEELIAKPNSIFDNWFKWNQVLQSFPWDWFYEESGGISLNWFCQKFLHLSVSFWLSFMLSLASNVRGSWMLVGLFIAFTLRFSLKAFIFALKHVFWSKLELLEKLKN